MRDSISQSLRGLKSAPALVTAAVLTLGLAIGINVAMVGLVHRALLGAPPHVLDPDRIVTLAFERGEGNERARMTTTTWVTFASIRDHVTALSGVAAWERTSSSIVVDNEQVRANAMIVSGGYFEVLGAGARLGRTIQPADDRAAAEPVAVLSHAFWRSTFGGDPGILGRRLTFNGQPYVVSGVMPPGFSGHSSADVDLWVPFAAAMRGTPGWEHNPFARFVDVLGRLDPNANAAMASAQSATATSQRVVLGSLGGTSVNATDRRVTFWLTGVSALVLVIGLANTATLFLVRASRRRRDFAIRAALGASRGRLFSQALVEAVAIAIAAAGLSVILASWFDGAIREVLLPDVAPADGIGAVTWMAAAVAGAMAAISAGLANASNIPLGISDAVRPAGRRPRLQTALLVLQTTLSVVLLAGAGLFGRSLYNLLSQDFGVRMDGVVLVDFETGAGFVPGQDGIYSTAVERVRVLPGVREATVINNPPFTGFNVPPISVPGHAEPPSVDHQMPFLHAATPEFFDILGIRILQGRGLTQADDRGAPVVVVNESMARATWPGESALGKCIRIGFDPDFDPETAVGPPVPTKVSCREVVGVAHDMRQRSVVPADNEDRLMQYFVPFSQVPVPPFIPNPGPRISGLMLKVDGDVASLAPAIRRAVVGTRDDLPFARVRLYSQLLDRQMRPWKLGTSLLALFSALAVLVGAVGLYAAFAHAVTLRRQEMAIRMAIGAQPRRVLSMILGEALLLAGMGIAAGVACAIAGGRWMQSLLYDTSSADPLVLTASASLMLVIAALATLLPAQSASRINPATLLRTE